MRFEQIKSILQSLRFRLTLWNTLLVLVMLSINLLAVREGLRWTLSSMVDDFLQEELNLAVEDVDRLAERPNELREELNRQARTHSRRQMFIQILDSSQSITWASVQSPPQEVLPPSPATDQVATSIGDFRCISREMIGPEGKPLVVRVGCSLERVESELNRFTDRLLEVAIVLLLVAPLGGFVLAGRATGPFARIITSTARLNPSHLDERLTIRGADDELDRLSRTINNFLDRIATDLRQSREFTANAAHELRSPLTALQSSIEIALNTDRTTEEYKDLLSVLLEVCSQMRVLVNQLLLLADSDAGRLRVDPHPIRLDQLVARSIEMFRAVADTKGVELFASRLESATIDGHSTQLWQVINNLLDNAIKFTPPGGRVAVALIYKRDSRRFILEVADNGVGIAAQDLPHIFDRFYQGDKARNRDTLSRGSGLGLSICQAVVISHGGKIEVVSSRTQGTTVIVTFPDSTKPPNDVSPE